MGGSGLQFVEGNPRLAFQKNGSGPAVIFLHGIGGNKSNWSDQTASLQNRFTTVAWDTRGYGQSDDYQGELTFSSFANDLERLMDWLSIETAHLVGLSMGGRILLDFQSRFPSRLATLTLCSTHYSYQNALTSEQRSAFISLRQKPLLEGKDFIDLAPALINSLVGPDCSETAQNKLKNSLLLLRKESYLKTIAASVDFEASGELEHINVPVQLIYGKHDSLTPPSIGLEMLKQIRNARIAIISNSGHLCNLEQPEEFNHVLAAFLDSHAERASILKG